MFYYKYEDKFLFSLTDDYGYERLDNIPDNLRELYFLYKSDRNKSKKTYAVSHASDIFIKEENLDMLKLKESYHEIPENIAELIEKRKVKAVNTDYEDYEECFHMQDLRKSTVNILALGDVGSTLLTGLKLLGGNAVSRIGIYDRSPEKVQRWEYEMNQVSYPSDFNALRKLKVLIKTSSLIAIYLYFVLQKGFLPLALNNPNNLNKWMYEWFSLRKMQS